MGLLCCRSRFERILIARGKGVWFSENFGARALSIPVASEFSNVEAW